MDYAACGAVAQSLSDYFLFVPRRPKCSGASREINSDRTTVSGVP